MYLRFETADVHAHVELGLNVTPKVHLMWKHLMWKHVFEQMLLDGGLWHKREDWVERLHQVTSKIREQHRDEFCCEAAVKSCCEKFKNS